MVPILLIAGNFLREHRWPLVTLLAYVALFGGGIGLSKRTDHEDILFFLRSLGMYGLAFMALLASSAIYNERRSRRILAVLSKGIERAQYVTGLLTGAALAGIIYCLAIGLMGSWALARNQLPVTQLWGLLAVSMSMFLLIATAALCFSTFLHPLFATIAAVTTLGAASAVAGLLGPPWSLMMPATRLMQSMLTFSYRGWHAPWLPAAWALADALLFWLLATLIFERRDIAVAVE